MALRLSISDVAVQQRIQPIEVVRQHGFLVGQPERPVDF